MFGWGLGVESGGTKMCIFLNNRHIYFFVKTRMQVGKLTLLTQGMNSEIYRYGCVDKGVILKMVAASCSKQSKHLANEFRILSSVNHQNIIKALKYKENIALNGTSKNVLVLENARHGSLLDYYGKARPNLNQVRWIYAELCEAIHYLHCNYIVHRDLKLENVLVAQSDSQIQIKLADFGFAASTKTSNLSNAYKGTKRGFMAPEIHKAPTQPQVMYDMTKTDVFALGVILFTLIMGRLPWEYATADNPHYRCISQGKTQQFWRMHQQVLNRVQNMQGANIEDFKQIFQDMVQEDASKRPKIDEVLECSWLKGKQQIMQSTKQQVESTTTVSN